MRLLIILLVIANILMFLRILVSQEAAPPVAHPFHPERVVIVSPADMTINPGQSSTATSAPNTSATSPSQANPAASHPPAASNNTSPLPASKTPATPPQPDKMIAADHQPAATADTPATGSASPPASAAEVAVAASAAVQASGSTPSASHKTDKPADKTLPPVCLSLGPVPAASTADAQTRLNALLLGDRLISRDNASAHGPYWIYLPPLASKQAADDKVAQLEKAGIKDVSVIRNGPWKNALSLGVFAKEDAAARRADSLKKLGIPVQIEAHGADRSFFLNKLSAREQNSVIQIAHDLGLAGLRVISCQGEP